MSYTLIKRSFALALGAALLLASSAHAENRALLMNIGQYSNPEWNLPGVAQDGKYAREIAQKMGYASNQITAMSDSKVTKSAVLSEIRKLVQSTGPGDQVLIYYSGHGAQTKDTNGDEADGCDEGLWLYEGVLLTDDELNAALSGIRAKEVLMVIDSCFSGTISKSLFSKSQTPKGKFPRKDGVCNAAVNKVRSVGLKPEMSAGQNNIYEFTAATDFQVAYDGAAIGIPGSLFTYALYQGLMKQSDTPTFAQLRDYAAGYISEQLNELKHTPQLIAPEKFANTVVANYARSAQVNTAPEPAPSTLEATFDEILNGSSIQVEIKSTKPRYRLDELISFDVMSYRDGYLNILELDPNGDVTVLFPNQFVSNNFVKATSVVSVPASIGGFKMFAMEPVGKSRILAFLTTEPFSLYDDKFGSKRSGLMVLNKASVAALHKGFKAVGLMGDQAKDTGYGAAEVRIEVTR